jgi:hypothetical protein
MPVPDKVTAVDQSGQAFLHDPEERVERREVAEVADRPAHGVSLGLVMDQ